MNRLLRDLAAGILVPAARDLIRQQLAARKPPPVCCKCRRKASRACRRCKQAYCGRCQCTGCWTRPGPQDEYIEFRLDGPEAANPNVGMQ